MTHITTHVVKITDLDNFDSKSLDEPIRLLQNGEVIAFPTETVYGLGANALNSEAVKKIFLAKGRPSDNPLIVHISSLEMLKKLVSEKAYPQPGSIAETLCKRFWPGALTILFEKSSAVPENVTAGQPMVAVRMPSHPVARRLIEISGIPLAAPSANVSGRPSPTQAKHVLEDLNGVIHCIIDGGSTDFGVESTVIDLSRDPPLILRPGGVTLEQLREYIPDVQVYEKKVHGTELEQAPPTPGLKYRHYSPSASVILFEEGKNDQNYVNMKTKLEEYIDKEIEQQRKVGLIHTHSKINHSKYQQHPHVTLYPLGDESHPDVVAQGIFGALRDLDQQKVNVIVVEGISENNEGLAVMNRIRKAASTVIQC